MTDVRVLIEDLTPLCLDVKEVHGFDLSKLVCSFASGKACETSQSGLSLASINSLVTIMILKKQPSYVQWLMLILHISSFLSQFGPQLAQHGRFESSARGVRATRREGSRTHQH